MNDQLLASFEKLTPTEQTNRLLDVISLIRSKTDLDEATDARLAQCYFAVQDGARRDREDLEFLFYQDLTGVALCGTLGPTDVLSGKIL